MGIYSEIHPFTTSIAHIIGKNPLAIILSGGPASVFEPDAPSVSPELFKLGIPVLGICYGMQLMAKVLGGKVVPSDVREYGVTGFHREKAISPIWSVFPDGDPVLMSHGDSILHLPSGFVAAGHTKTTPYAAMEDDKRKTVWSTVSPGGRSNPEWYSL
ncbi:GMP synthase large subunit, partial [mine drainage metagenome]